MAKKNFDNLVSNMIGEPKAAQISPTQVANNSLNQDSAPSKPQRGRPIKNTDLAENFCGRADSNKLAKIRAVAEKENVAIKDLYNLAFDLFIKAYEEKHGPIHIKSRATKGDAKSLI